MTSSSLEFPILATVAATINPAKNRSYMYFFTLKMNGLFVETNNKVKVVQKEVGVFT